MSSRVTTSPGRSSISASSWKGCSCRRTASLPRRTSRRRMSTSTPPNCTIGLGTSWLTTSLVWPRASPVTRGVSAISARCRHVSPPCHLGGIEACDGGPQCWVMSMLAAALMVTIRVYDIYGLSPDTRQQALAIAAQTLERAGVQAAIVDCSGVAPATPCKLGLAEGEMILRIQRHPKDGVHVLGEAIVNGASGPNTVATVYAAAIAERARRDGTPLASIVGRVSAHEIGHLLLGTNSHAAHGLMRATWNVQRIDRGDWDFTLEDAARIRARLQPHEPTRVLVARADP